MIHNALCERLQDDTEPKDNVQRATNVLVPGDQTSLVIPPHRTHGPTDRAVKHQSICAIL